MLSNAGKNTMLDNWGGDYLSLHTAWPGDSGTNEATGGSPAYARKLGTFAAASGGTKALSASVTFDVAAATYKFVGRWSALTAGTFRGCVPLNGANKRFSVVVVTDVFTVIAHGWADTQKVVFINGTPPTGLTEGTTYFVRDATTDTFKVAATSGGAAIDITGQAAAGCVVSAITEEVLASQGQVTVSSFQQGLNG